MKSKLVLTLRHVVVEDNVDTFNIHATTEQVGGDQDAALEVLEELVPLKTLLLVHRAVNVNRRKVLLLQQSRQGDAPLDGLHENDDLEREVTLKTQNDDIPD